MQIEFISRLTNFQPLPPEPIVVYDEISETLIFNLSFANLFHSCRRMLLVASIK